MKNFKRKYFIYIILGISVVNGGCKKDWFDVKSDINLTVPATLQDFEYLLDNMRMNSNSPGLGEVGSDGHYIPDNAWDQLNNLERNTYIWTTGLYSSNLGGDWDPCYNRIFQCNLVLDGLKKLNPSQEINKYNRIKGNALFHKAKNYYDLAQIYAQPYQAISAATDVGIPLKEGIDVTEPAKQATVKETYDQILSDLHSAAGLLPIQPEVKTRGSKVAVFSLLARTYLTIGDYVKAGLYADSSLNLYNKLINFNSIIITATDMGFLNAETIFFSFGNSAFPSTYLNGFYAIDPALYNSYDNNDLRKTRFFLINNATNSIEFKGHYNDLGVCFTGLAVDEQFLIRAECYARSGNTLAAMKDLNDLLRSRWNAAVSYPTRTAIDAEDALRQILIERKKELLFRALRWTDLRRLNLDPRFKTTITRTIRGETFTLEPGSYRYTLPIPQAVLNIAPLMKQTPGW